MFTLYWNLFLWVFLKIWFAGIWWAGFSHSVQRCHNFIECTILAFFANGWGLFSFFRSSLSTVLIFLIIIITLIFWLHFIFLLVFQRKPYSQMGNKRWNSLEAPDSVLFPWDLKSTYIITLRNNGSLSTSDQIQLHFCTGYSLSVSLSTAHDVTGHLFSRPRQQTQEHTE